MRKQAGTTAAVLLVLAFGAATAAAQESGRTAERVRIAFPRDVGTLTPYSTFDDLGYPLMTLVYDTLTWRGGGDWLVRRGRYQKAGTRIVILLRKGARWHDGRRVTPADVAFSYNYFKRRYHPRFTPQLAPFEDAEVVSDRKVAINLAHATPGFGEVLADVPIIPRHLWEGLAEGQEPLGLPVGSGPYELVRHRVGESYRFRATDGYFLGEPRVRTIDVPFMPDYDQRLRALRDKEVDAIGVPLRPEDEERVQSSKVKVANGTLLSGTALMFNTRAPPFDVVRARRAVASALDLTGITQATLGRVDERSSQADRGYVSPASGFAADGILHDFNLGRARAEFDELDLPPIRVLTPDEENDPVRAKAGRLVASALRRAGANATSEELPPARLAAAVGEDGSQPTFEAAISSTPTLASRNSDFLSVVFGSRSQQLSPLNYAGYANPRFDELARRAERETNPFDRSVLIRRQLKLLTDDAPVVALFYPEGLFAYRWRVYDDGWHYVPGTGILDKTSFVTSDVGSRPDESTAPFAGSQSGGGIGALGIVALAMIGAMALFVVLGLVGRVRAR